MLLYSLDLPVQLGQAQYRKFARHQRRPQLPQGALFNLSNSPRLIFSSRVNRQLLKLNIFREHCQPKRLYSPRNSRLGARISGHLLPQLLPKEHLQFLLVDLPSPTRQLLEQLRRRDGSRALLQHSTGPESRLLLLLRLKIRRLTRQMLPKRRALSQNM